VLTTHATTMPRPDFKVAATLRYYDDPDGAGVRCACHSAHYDTPDEMVKGHTP
jgi:Rieske Fe-S protein